VKRFDKKSRAIEEARDFRGVGLAIFQTVWDEKDTSDGAIKIQDVGSAVVEITGAARDE
jgi:hypothetical protein